MWPPYWPSGPLEELDVERSTVSADNRLTDIIMYWKSRSVDYGVVDKSLVNDSEIEAATAGETVVFENSRYQILQLSKN